MEYQPKQIADMIRAYESLAGSVKELVFYTERGPIKKHEWSARINSALDTYKAQVPQEVQEDLKEEFKGLMARLQEDSFD